MSVEGRPAIRGSHHIAFDARALKITGIGDGGDLVIGKAGCLFQNGIHQIAAQISKAADLQRLGKSRNMIEGEGDFLYRRLVHVRLLPCVTFSHAFAPSRNRRIPRRSQF